MGPHDEVAGSVEEEVYFQEGGKMSWKMKAISFICLVIFSYDDDVSINNNDAIKA